MNVNAWVKSMLIWWFGGLLTGVVVLTAAELWDGYTVGGAIIPASTMLTAMAMCGLSVKTLLQPHIATIVATSAASALPIGLIPGQNRLMSMTIAFLFVLFGLIYYRHKRGVGSAYPAVSSASCDDEEDEEDDPPSAQQAPQRQPEEPVTTFEQKIVVAGAGGGVPAGGLTVLELLDIMADDNVPDETRMLAPLILHARVRSEYDGYVRRGYIEEPSAQPALQLPSTQEGAWQISNEDDAYRVSSPPSLLGLALNWLRRR